MDFVLSQSFIRFLKYFLIKKDNCFDLEHITEEERAFSKGLVSAREVCINGNSVDETNDLVAKHNKCFVILFGKHRNAIQMDGVFLYKENHALDAWF